MDDVLQQTEAIEGLEPEEAILAYKGLIFENVSSVKADVIKAKETAIDKITKLYIEIGDAAALRSFLTELRPFFASLSKAKTAKIVRSIIDSIAKIPNSVALQVYLNFALENLLFLFQLDVCKEQVEWARQEKRNFLRQRIEARLANLYLEGRDFQSALQLIGT